MPETEPKTEPKAPTVTVKLGDRATIIDPETGLRHLPGSSVTIPADRYENPLSRHWRRQISAGSCTLPEKKKSPRKG